MKLIKKRTGVKRLAVCPKCKRKEVTRITIEGIGGIVEL